MSNPPTQASGPAVNRLADVMAHTTRYAFRGTSRLAFDAKLDPSTLSRLVRGEINPSFLLVARIATAFEAALGIRIDPRELIAEEAAFPTRFICDLVGCSGCLPENAYDEFGSRKAAFQDVRPGEWVTSLYPHGLIKEEVHA